MKTLKTFTLQRFHVENDTTFLETKQLASNCPVGTCGLWLALYHHHHNAKVAYA